MYKGGVKAPQSWSFPRWHGEGHQPELLNGKVNEHPFPGPSTPNEACMERLSGSTRGQGGELEEESIGLVQRNDCTEGVVYFSVDQCAGELQSYAYRMLGGGTEVGWEGGSGRRRRQGWPV